MRVTAFLYRFTVVYCILIAPWPGWSRAYGGYFRSLVKSAGSLAPDSWAIRVEALPRSSARPLDVRVSVANHGGLRLDYDSRGIGWIPSALGLALLVATPFRRGRRWRALLVGAVALQVYALGAVAIDVAIQAGLPPDHGLGVSAAWVSAIARGLDETCVVQIGPAFVLPVLVWLMLAWRVLNGGLATDRLRVGDIKAPAAELN